MNNLLQFRLGQVFKLIIAIGISFSAGAIGSLYTMQSIQSGWYAGLVKPAMNPPAWVFGPVWTILYVLMGIALFLVWSFNTTQDKSIDTTRDKKQHSNILENVRMLRLWKIGIVAFFVQLFLNATWSIIFFGSTSLTINGLNNIGIAFIEIILLWLAIVWTIVVFYKISRPAAFLLIPYILWVSFAGYLNYSIWTLNQEINQETPVFCTMDAKECPDGSYVGRVAPSCDFALCPPVALCEGGACPEARTIKLYYYNYELDQDESGNIACSRNGLVSVERKIPVSKTPIQDAVKLLLLGELTEEERGRGIDTEYPLDGLSLKGAFLKDGVLTLEFDDPNNKTVGGSCRVGILWFQIETTAKQFPEVLQTRFLPEDIFQP